MKFKNPDLKFEISNLKLLSALAWMALIFFFSAQPKNELPAFGAWDLLIKKSGHMLEYAVLAGLWHDALGKRLAWGAWGIAVLYAISDEFHQSFVPGRHATLTDIGFDTIGTTTGLFLAIRFQQQIQLIGKSVVSLVTNLLGK